MFILFLLMKFFLQERVQSSFSSFINTQGNTKELQDYGCSVVDGFGGSIADGLGYVRRTG